MNRRLRTTLVSLLDLQSIVFGYALFNFALVWSEAWHYSTSGIAGIVSPWYDPWSYGNQPTLLLIAAVFLRLRRPWAYLTALGVSGYLVVDIVYRFSVSQSSFWQEWNYIRKCEPYLAGSWHSQYILALLISVLATWYLWRVIRRTNASTQTDG